VELLVLVLVLVLVLPCWISPNNRLIDGQERGVVAWPDLL